MSQQHMAAIWEEEADLYGLWTDKRRRRMNGEDNDKQYEIFRRHGWNMVDSGFRLWGAGKKIRLPSNTDKFLKSKGWNDMDSGFRII
jgi:hypothetical protein